MKALIIISLLAFVFTSAQGQDENSFFKSERTGSYKHLLRVSPQKETYSTEGKHGGILVDPNGLYFRNLFSTIARKSFTNEEKQILNTKGKTIFVTFYLDMEGNFLRCEFLMLKETMQTISKESLLKFYNSIMQTKVDTSKWGEIEDNGKFDYINMSTIINPNKWGNSYQEEKEK